MTGIIYALLDPRTNATRYIGQTRRTLIVRVRGHLAAARRPRNHCTRWMAQLVQLGLEPCAIVLEEPPLADLNNAERRWIAAGRESGWPLTNVTTGGDESPMCNPAVAAVAIERSLRTRRTPESRRIASEAHLKLWRDPDYAAHMSDVHRGIKPTGIGARGRLARPGEVNPMSDPDVRQRATASRTGRPLSAAHRQNISLALRARKEAS